MGVAKDRVYELRKELVFWERLYENDAPCEREFRLQEQIEALENRDQFGIPQFSIPQYTDYMYWDSNTDDVIVDPPKCKHCGTTTHQP